MGELSLPSGKVSRETGWVNQRRCTTNMSIHAMAEAIRTVDFLGSGGTNFLLG